MTNKSVMTFISVNKIFVCLATCVCMCLSLSPHRLFGYVIFDAHACMYVYMCTSYLHKPMYLSNSCMSFSVGCVHLRVCTHVYTRAGVHMFLSIYV